MFQQNRYHYDTYINWLKDNFKNWNVKVDNKDFTVIRKRGIIETPNTYKETTIKINEQIKLTAKVLPTNATNQNITWESSNTSVATVDNTGKIIGKKATDKELLSKIYK